MDVLRQDFLRLVSVVLKLVRTTDIETEVFGLDRSELGELDAASSKMGTGDLLVERLGEHVDADWVRGVVGP